jgi:hypothetical protein
MNTKWSTDPFNHLISLIMFLQEYTEVCKRQNGCGVSQRIAILGAHFHSNGDGYNDYWNVKGECQF